MKEKKRPLMSGIDIMKMVESIIILALIVVACFCLYAAAFKNALHQLIIGLPSAALAITLLWHQTREKEYDADA